MSTVNQPGIPIPFCDRSVVGDLKLFSEMRDGIYREGGNDIRAKIDMAPQYCDAGSYSLRIIHDTHHRNGDKWCNYPMYDYAHGQCDSIVLITHSLHFRVRCTSSLYDWFNEKLKFFLYINRNIAD